MCREVQEAVESGRVMAELREKLGLPGNERVAVGLLRTWAQDGTIARLIGDVQAGQVRGEPERRGEYQARFRDVNDMEYYEKTLKIEKTVDKKITGIELEANKDALENINTIHDELNRFIRESKKEKLVLYDDVNNKIIIEQEGQTINDVAINKQALAQIKKAPNHSLIFIHVHPTDTPFSKDDIAQLINNKSIRAITVECISGKKYILQKGNQKIGVWERLSFRDKYDSIYNKIAEQYPELDSTETRYEIWDTFIDHVLREIAEYYGLVYAEVK